MRFISYSVLGLLLVLPLGGTVAFGQVSASDGKTPEPGTLTFEGSRAEAEKLMAYHRSIHLTPEQEATKREALEDLRLPVVMTKSAAASSSIKSGICPPERLREERPPLSPRQVQLLICA